MEGTISEIRIFAGSFSPRYWAFCQGQTLNVNSNQALFSLLGTTYGGNGSSTFMLPDLRGRVPVGTGQGPGLSTYTLGEVTGVNTVTLNLQQIISHTHPVVVTPGGGGGSGSVTLNGINDTGGNSTPAGNYLSADSNSLATPYAQPNVGNPVQMAASSIAAADIKVPPPTLAIGSAGGGQAHNNIMPSIALNYVICINGLYPSRN